MTQAPISRARVEATFKLREPLINPMYRSFVPQARQLLGEGGGAYSKQSVTEPSTTQMADLRPNPSGSGSFAAAIGAAD